MRAGAEIIYQATFVQGDWRGRADFLERVDQPTALGAWGYEALDAKLARAEKSTYVLQLCFYTEAIASIQHATPEKMHVLLGIGEQRTCATPTSPPTTAASAPAVRGARAARRPEPYRVEHCALCEFRQVCDDDGGRRPPAAGGRHPARPGQPPALGRPPHAKAARPGTGDAGPQRRRPHVRDPSRPGRAAAPPAHHRRPRLARAAHRAGMRLRAAAAALARRRHLRYRGRSVLGAGARSALPLRSADSRSRIPGDLGAQPGRGAPGARAAGRLLPRAAPAAPRHARLPLRRLRADGAEAAHGRVRDARGRDGRAAAPRDLLRSAFGRAPGPAGGRAGVLAERSGSAARLPPPGARHERHARRAGLRSLDDHARSRAARRDHGLQRGRLPRDARAARLAGRAPARRRGLGQAPRGGSGRRRQAEGRRKARGAAPGVARGRDRNAALAGRRAARIPPARGPARLVVDVHALPDVARRAGGRRRVDRPARPRERRDR